MVKSELKCPGCKKVIAFCDEELVANVKGLVWHPKCYTDHCNEMEESSTD